jgi:putative glycosyltransferase (TIGR04348 family)
METPDRPIILALTGTDLYRDIHRNQSARQALSLADRLVLLHDKAPGDLPPRLRSRAHVIFQSAKPTPIKRATAVTQFRVVVIGHMRHEKDPFRTAMAVRSLPASSTIEVEHYGAAREPRMAELARREMKRNPRYRWFGTQPNWKVRRRLARAQLLVLSSRMEGGANVLSEALADQIPILAARISCTRGVLGDSYKGFFEVGDTRALRDLLLKAELDTAYLKTLCSQCKRRRHLIDPRNEARAWKQLLGALISN